MALPQGPSPDVLPAISFSPHQVRDLVLIIYVPLDRLGMAEIAVPAKRCHARLVVSHGATATGTVRRWENPLSPRAVRSRMGGVD
jgi:hypothetical protein